MLPLELAQEQRHEVGARARRRAKRKSAAEAAAVQRGKVLQQLLLELEDPLRASVQAAPRLGGLHPPSRAVE